MTVHYDVALGDDVSLVRFHCGDTDIENGHYLEDETIQYFVTSSSVEQASLTCIRYIISQLSKPDFKLDWLQVSREKARQGYEKLLDDKADEFGISTSVLRATSTIVLPMRADSYMEDADQDGAP